MAIEGAIHSGMGVQCSADTFSARRNGLHAPDGPREWLGPDRLTMEWNRTAGRALKIGGTLTLVANLCVSGTLLLSEPVPASLATVAAAVLIGLSQLVLAIGFLRGRFTAPLVHGVVLATVTGLVLAAVDPSDQLDRPWWPAHVALTTVAFVVFARPGRVGRSLALMVAGANVVTDLWRLMPDSGLTRVAVDATQTATIAAYVLLFAHALNRAIAAADHSVQSAAAAFVAVALEQGRGRRARDFERFVHDKVIDTLHAIAIDRAVVGGQSAQHLAADLRPRLDEFVARTSAPAGTLDLTRAIREVIASVPLAVSLRARSPVEADAGVVAAMAAASAEALRNVARHSGASRATVLVRRDGPGAMVIIRDRGTGFDPAHVPAHRHGLRASIYERMADVQGLARVASSPGRGTVVSLIWRPLSRASSAGPEDSETAHGVMTPALRDFARVMTPTFGWAGVAMVLLSQELARPWIGVAATLTVLGFGALYWWRAFSVGLSGVDHVVLTLVAVLASTANGLALHPGETDMATYWLAGGSTGLVLLCVLLRPMAESVWSGTAIAVTPLLTLAVSAGGELRPETVPAVIAAPLAVSCAFAVRLLIDRFSEWLARTEDAGARAWARERLMESSRRQVTDRALEISELTGPLVTAVAEGFRDPGDPRIREEAARLEQWLRDDLALNHLPSTREAVWLARCAGWKVSVRSSPAPARELDAIASRLVAALAGGPDSIPWEGEGELELTLRPLGGQWALSAIVHRAPEEAAAALVELGHKMGLEVVVDPGYVHLRGLASDSVLQ